MSGKHGSREQEQSIKKVESPCRRAEIEALEPRLLLSTYYLDDWDTTTANFVAHGTNTHQIPTDYSVDVTAYIQGAIADVPNGNTLEFPDISYDVSTTGYKVEDILSVNNRHDLTFTGNGVIIKRFVAGDIADPDTQSRRHWDIGGTSSNIWFEDVTIYGPNANGNYDADRAFQHAFRISGAANGITINNCHMTHVYGDGVYTAFGGTVRNVTISNNVIDGTGRQGIAPCGGEFIVIDGNEFHNNRHTIDIEPETSSASVGYLTITNNYFGAPRTGGFDINGGGRTRMVYMANNTYETCTADPIWAIFGEQRTGPFICVNNQWACTDFAHTVTMTDCGGVLYAGNKTVYPQSNPGNWTGVNAFASCGNVIVGENLMTYAVAAANNADYAWNNSFAVDPSWTSPVTVTQFAGRPNCYYLTMPYTGGGTVKAILRLDGSDDLLTYPSGLLTTHSCYAVAILNAGGSVVYSAGFDDLTYYNGTARSRMVYPDPSPTRPGSLQATPVTSTQVDLAWTDNTANETGFKIERAPDVSSSPATFVQIATNSANDVTYTDSTVSYGTKYWYRVRANWGADDGDYSANVNVTTPSTSFTETWTGANGDPWPSVWTFTSTGFTKDIYSLRGRLSGASSSVKAYYNAMTTTDSTQVVKFNVSANNGQPGLISRITSGDNDTFYCARTGRTDSNLLYIQKCVDNTWTILSTITLGFTVTGGSNWYYLKFNTAGSGSTTLSAKCWLSTDPEPADWNGTVSDSTAVLQRTGSGGVYYWTGSTRTCLFDDYNVTWASAPAAPTGLGVTTYSASQLNLSWTDTSSNENGFKIERAPDVAGSPGTFAQIDTVGANVTSYNNSTGLSVETKYWYRVRAYNGIGDSAYTSNVSGTTLCPAPSDLSATTYSASQINLSWTDNSGTETGFRIERSPNGTGNWTEIATVDADETTYADTGLSAGTTYYYRMRAYNGAGGSGYSNVASAATLDVAPVAPSGLTALAASAGLIHLNWADNSGNETGFLIERSPDGIAGWTEIAAVGAHVSAYDDAGLPQSTSYWYRIRAHNGVGNSAYCDAAGATTLDVTAPTVTGIGINLGATTRSIIRVLDVYFDEAVNVTKDDLELYDYSTDSLVDLSAATFSYNAGAHEATWDLTAVELNNAYFDATVGTTATDAAGNHLAAPYVHQFLKLAGDANGDGSVDVGDLGILGENYGTTLTPPGAGAGVDALAALARAAVPPAQDQAVPVGLADGPLATGQQAALVSLDLPLPSAATVDVVSTVISDDTVYEPASQDGPVDVVKLLASEELAV